jgi:Chromate transporter
VLVVMLKLGTIDFGGPAAHVAMLREETVRRRRWLQDAEFLDLFGAVSMPGPSLHPSGRRALTTAGGRSGAAGWRGLLHPARHGDRGRRRGHLPDRPPGQHRRLTVVYAQAV